MFEIKRLWVPFCYSFVVNETPPIIRLISAWFFGLEKDEKPDWKPQNPWFYGAFPVCRNYTVRALKRHAPAGPWHAPQADSGVARPQRFQHDRQHLRPPGRAVQDQYSRRHAPLSGPWSAGRFEPGIRKKPSNNCRLAECGGEDGIRTHVPFPTNWFRVFYSQHTLADFEKKCPILRVNALVRKKMIFSPLRLFPTVRNARELSERTNRTAIKHNSRKSP